MIEGAWFYNGLSLLVDLSRACYYINLHKHFFGCPPNSSHGAEVDCLALMRITAVLENDWLEWA